MTPHQYKTALCPTRRHFERAEEIKASVAILLAENEKEWVAALAQIPPDPGLQTSARNSPPPRMTVSFPPDRY